jgi:CubicO group peptidase (beta-lactamase class C family)
MNPALRPGGGATPSSIRIDIPFRRNTVENVNRNEAFRNHFSFTSLLSFPVIRLAAVFVFIAVCSTSVAETNSTPKSIAELRAGIEEILKETKTPGAAIAIVSTDKVEWTAGIGMADVAANKPATDDTLFRIGSISKGFAALAALRLSEAGELNLNDTVRHWVPDVAFTNPWEATNPVHLVNLMEHTTGFDDIHMREYALSDPTPMSLNDALAFGASSRVSRWPPGSRMSYCNSGPAVLAAVIEKVSGEHFEDYVQKHFFNPLHMDTASYFYTPEVEQRLTKLYHNDGVTPYPYWHIAYRPAGAINASAKDMANYVRFYLQRGSFDGVQLLRPDSIERMETPETLPAAKLGPFAGYGLYNNATCDGAFVFHGHAGAVMGGVSEMGYLPGYGRGYAIMINTSKSAALVRISTLIRQYITRGLTPPALPPAEKVPAEIQQHYAGFYQSISPRKQKTQGVLRLFDIRSLTFTTNGFDTTTFGVHRERWVGMGNNLFRKAGQSAATFALVPDDHGMILLQTPFQTFKKVSAFGFFGQIFAILFLCAVMASSVLYGIIRCVLKVFGIGRNKPANWVRRMPLWSIALLGIYFGFFALGGNDPMMWGTPNWRTIGVLFASIAFPLACAASLYLAWRNRAAAMNRFVYWHSVLVAVAVTIVAIYLGYWGMLCVRMWA